MPHFSAVASFLTQIYARAPRALLIIHLPVWTKVLEENATVLQLRMVARHAVLLKTVLRVAKCIAVLITTGWWLGMWHSMSFTLSLKMYR